MSITNQPIPGLTYSGSTTTKPVRWTLDSDGNIDKKWFIDAKGGGDITSRDYIWSSHTERIFDTNDLPKIVRDLSPKALIEYIIHNFGTEVVLKSCDKSVIIDWLKKHQ